MRLNVNGRLKVFIYIFPGRVQRTVSHVIERRELDTLEATRRNGAWLVTWECTHTLSCVQKETFLTWNLCFFCFLMLMLKPVTALLTILDDLLLQNGGALKLLGRCRRLPVLRLNINLNIISKLSAVLSPNQCLFSSSTALSYFAIAV